MADEADRAQILEEAEREAGILAVPRELAKGNAGECRLCGVPSLRLVHGACAYCREQAEKDAAIRKSRRRVEI